MFRGREQSRPELGFRLLQRLAGDVEELGFVESQPRQDGRNMIMVIGPHRRKSEARAERATRDAHHGERPISRSRAAVAVAANAVAAEAEAVEADRDEQSPDAAQAAARPQPAASASAVGRGSAPKAAAEG